MPPPARAQINGKSANLNSCLKNVIFRELAARPSKIPKTEILVVFDADMCPKPNFFLKASSSRGVRLGHALPVQ